MMKDVKDVKFVRADLVHEAIRAKHSVNTTTEQTPAYFT
jgi:hypothetical protein